MLKLAMDPYFASDSQPFALYVSDPECNDCEHCHEFDELVMVESGHGLHVLNGRPGFIQQGDVFFVRSSDRHFYDRLGSLKLTNLLINTHQPLRYLRNLEPLLAGINRPPHQPPGWLTPEDRQICHTTFHRLLSPDGDEPQDDADREMAWLQLILSLNRSLLSVSRNHTHYKARTLIHWLQTHCMEEMDWDRLSHEFLLSKRSLYRHIHEVTGLPPQQFIRQLRLLMARTWLQTGEESITEIAFRCGFNSSNHFSASYKNLFGHSPSQALRARGG